MTPRRAAVSEEPQPEADRLAGFPHPRAQTHLFGHDASAAALAQAARAGRLAHGLLLTGPKGVGKATLAWRLTHALLTHPASRIPDDLSSLPGHPALALTAGLAHPDVMLVRRPWDEKAKKFKSELPIDEIRRLNGFFGRHAAEGGWRVALIDAADEMSRQAENALLKTLEEPPRRSLLILIAHRPGSLLPTTRSRCRRLALGPLAPGPMADALAHLNADGAQADTDLLMALAEGAPGRALALGLSGGAQLARDVMRLLGQLPRPDLGHVTALAERLARPAAAEDFALGIALIGQILRWMIVAEAGSNTPLLRLAQDGQRLIAAAKRAPLERWVAVWDKLQASVERADALNLDKRHTIVSAFLEAEAGLRGPS